MLAAAIEKKREQMIKAAKIHGLSSKQVLKCSQELDRMIHLYHTQTQNRYESTRKRFVLFKSNGSSLDFQALKKAQ